PGAGALGSGGTKQRHRARAASRTENSLAKPESPGRGTPLVGGGLGFWLRFGCCRTNVGDAERGETRRGAVDERGPLGRAAHADRSGLLDVGRSYGVGCGPSGRFSVSVSLVLRTDRKLREVLGLRAASLETHHRGLSAGPPVLRSLPRGARGPSGAPRRRHQNDVENLGAIG